VTFGMSFASPAAQWNNDVFLRQMRQDISNFIAQFVSNEWLSDYMALADSGKSASFSKASNKE
jgi:hypothetical protein